MEPQEEPSDDDLQEHLSTITPYTPKVFEPQKGRVKGQKNKVTLLREAILNKQEAMILRELPKIVAVVCKKAIEGDLTAAKLILERIIPIRRHSSDGMSDSNSKSAPTINIVIEGSGGREHVIKINTPPSDPIDDADFNEVDTDE